MRRASAAPVGEKRFIGYRVATAHWRKGIAREAVRLMVELDASRPIFANVLVGRVASVRALSRNGYVTVREQTSDDGPEVVLRLG